MKLHGDVDPNQNSLLTRFTDRIRLLRWWNERSSEASNTENVTSSPS